MRGKKGKPVALASAGASLHVGTSGWSYGGWDRIFYPEGTKSTADRLSFYARHFNTVEVNYSFYHLPKPETYKKWAVAVPPRFQFAVKASRFITHIRRLKGIKVSWKKFMVNAQTLKKRLGPVLFQFPPSFRADPNSLSEFLEHLRKHSRPSLLYPVFEFRHTSWFSETIYDILRQGKATLCIAHSERYPCVEEITSDLVYYRFHGPKSLFASRYTDPELRSWAKRIRPLLSNGKKIFVYFNNDFHGYAIENARTLQQMIEDG